MNHEYASIGLRAGSLRRRDSITLSADATRRKHQRDAAVKHGFVAFSERVTMHRTLLVFGCFVGLAIGNQRGHSADQATQWKAGAATAISTPKSAMPMAGYASRTEPSEGTEQDLFAKALVLDDGRGGRVAIVTLDLIGVLDRLRSRVTEQLANTFQLPPEAVLMNASHTHCGPAYGGAEAQAYFDSLVTTLVELVGRAIDDLKPATLTYSNA